MATCGSTTGSGCRDKDDPAVIAHLEAENAYTEAVTAAPPASETALFDEIVARIEETDLSVPVRKGPWLYYSRTVEGSSYGIHCRRPATADQRRGPGGRPEESDHPRREPARRGARLLRARQPLGEPRPPVAGLLDGHHRRRALHHALPRPRHRRRVARVDRGHLLRRGLGQRQRHRLLRPGRRGHAPLPALAAPGRDRSLAATPWSTRSPTTASTSASGGPRTTGSSSAGSTPR